MNGDIYEYSKGDRKLFLEKVGFQARNIYNVVSCLGGTRDVVDKLNNESLDLVREEGGDLNIWVHGIFQNYHRFLKGTVDWFGRRGVIVVPVGYDYSCSTEESAKKIAFEIDALMKKAGVDKINLIGVSYGGCVARHYVQHFSGHKKVDKLISVCSPYSELGSNTIAYWMGKLVSKEEEDVDIFNCSSFSNHFAIHALGDRIIGKQKMSCSEISQIFVNGGHNPSSNDPRKLELVLKILKGEIS